MSRKRRKRGSGNSFIRTGLLTALVANLLVLGVLGYAAYLENSSADAYYRAVQEDEWLEWASFWAFGLAGVLFVATAFRQWRATGKLPWFATGVALFCWFVALEEISWGQRLLGYRPPTYFLVENFQQELNIHNVVDTKYRKLALKGVILGYGVVLPVLALLPGLREILRRLGMEAPPLALAPAFLAAYVLYVKYPWTHTGEWVELMLGLGFLFAALLGLRRYPRAPATRLTTAHPALVLAASWLLVLALGAANAAASRRLVSRHPEAIAAARGEALALKRDFLTRQLPTKCGLHKRIYTYKEQFHQDYLLEGAFSRLTAQGLPEARAEYFLDPWNSPYWIRAQCSDDRSRVSVYVYSFGPNRRRDSDRWQIVDDDVGAYIIQTP
jgi:hypothetical protein